MKRQILLAFGLPLAICYFSPPVRAEMHESAWALALEANATGPDGQAYSKKIWPQIQRALDACDNVPFGTGDRYGWFWAARLAKDGKVLYSATTASTLKTFCVKSALDKLVFPPPPRNGYPVAMGYSPDYKPKK